MRLSRKTVHRPNADPHEVVQGALDRVNAVDLTPSTVVWSLTWGFLNWISDVRVSSPEIKAIGVPVPSAQSTLGLERRGRRSEL